MYFIVVVPPASGPASRPVFPRSRTAHPRFDRRVVRRSADRPVTGWATRRRPPVAEAGYMNATGSAVRARGLRKNYGGVAAVSGIDLEIAPGEVFALLGPNGAGKTTTVEILEGYRDRDGGEVSVLDEDPALGERDLKERIGIVLQETNVNRFLTVGETIDLYRGYYPRP